MNGENQILPVADPSGKCANPADLCQFTGLSSNPKVFCHKIVKVAVEVPVIPVWLRLLMVL